MGVINMPKLLKVYKELYSNYRNEYGILIIQEGLTKEEIQNLIDKADYIKYIIRIIEEDYIAKDKRCITATEVDKFIYLLDMDVSNLSVKSTVYTLYLKAIQLMEK